MEAKAKRKLSKQTKKYILNISIMVIVTAIAMFFIFKDNPKEVIQNLQNCNLLFLVIALLIMLGFYLVEGLILTVLARMYKRDYPYYKGCLNCMIGAFFSGITPSNSGGQFVQAYTFSKQGIKITNAASILLMHFIVYQIVSVIFSAGILIFKFEELRSFTSDINIFGFKFEILSLAVIGFAINTLMILGLLFAAFSKKLHSFITTTGVSIMYKLHLCKNKEQKSIELNAKFESFRIELKRLMQNANVLIVTVLLFLIKMILYNVIPFFIALSLGVGFSSENTFMNIVNCTSMSLFSTTITAMVPIPGASGGAELVFKMLFNNFFVADSSKINAIILIWRSVTYYIGLLIGFVVFLLYHESPKKESLHGNEKTLLQLRIVALDNENKTLKLLDKEELEPTDEEYLSPEEIEERFKKLKDELSSQLKNNEESLEKESKKK
ncbi:MAG: flippase-like domain-containing protein [Bacilli bacterium]|nr:flippase-like domain-containing protein [Bacillales bacterium]MDY2575471.1 flippase-like domain-containing protein [Bacilli bacterium]